MLDEDGEEQMRTWMDQRFRAELSGKTNVVILDGSFENRFKQAQRAIDQAFPALVAECFTESR